MRRILKLHGVTRLNGKGIPLCVQQYEVNDKFSLDEVRNSVKVAGLEGDSVAKKILAISFVWYNKSNKSW